jgi:hypothetical protein
MSAWEVAVELCTLAAKTGELMATSAVAATAALRASDVILFIVRPFVDYCYFIIHLLAIRKIDWSAELSRIR